MTLPFDPVRFVKMMSARGHNAALGLTYHAHGPDSVSLALPWREDLVGDARSGVLASGPIFTLMDMAATIAIWQASQAFSPQATVDMRLDYLRPATPGKTVIGRGECYRITRRIAFVRGEAHDGDPSDPVAHMAGTYMFTSVE